MNKNSKAILGTFSSAPRSAALATAVLGGLLTVSGCAEDDGALGEGSGESGESSSGSDGEAGSETDHEPIDFGERGAWAVGYRTSATSTAAGEMRLGVWYPASASAGAVEEITYSFLLKNPEWGADPVEVYGEAIRGAEADAAGGPYPVVVFSHGFGANALWYSQLLEHLSSHGFVVVAPEHRENDWFQNSVSVVRRPRDVSAALDQVEREAQPGGLLAGIVDLDQVAVVGHSFGGYTALASAGALIEMNELNQRCGALAEDDPRGFLCLPLAGREADLADLAGLETVPASNFPSFADPRVKAIVPIAGDAYMFDSVGLNAVSVPMLAIGGTADTGTPMEWGAQLSYDQVGSPERALAAFEGAEHMFVINDCSQMPWTPEFPFYELMCFDPVWEKDAGHAHVNLLTTAFLRYTLMGDAQALPVLAADAPTLPGVTYSSTIGSR